MIEDNWDLIQGEAAHAIEVLNYSNQVNVIEALVHLLMHQHTGDDGTCRAHPNERVLKEFHRTATLFLLIEPGEYRDCPVAVATQDGVVVHQPPPPEEVPANTAEFFEGLKARWRSATAQEIGAYALWMINWIHPFKNGNGRTARAFCYACISLKLGFVVPGRPTVIDMIMQRRPQYEAALKAADIAYQTSGEPDLTAMIEFLDVLLYEQISSI